jgi:hypothetical protein
VANIGLRLDSLRSRWTRNAIGCFFLEHYGYLLPPHELGWYPVALGLLEVRRVSTGLLAIGTGRLSAPRGNGTQACNHPQAKH